MPVELGDLLQALRDCPHEASFVVKRGALLRKLMGRIKVGPKTANAAIDEALTLGILRKVRGGLHPT